MCEYIISIRKYYDEDSFRKDNETSNMLEYIIVQLRELFYEYIGKHGQQLPALDDNRLNDMIKKVELLIEDFDYNGKKFDLSNTTIEQKRDIFNPCGLPKDLSRYSSVLLGIRPPLQKRMDKYAARPKTRYYRY